MSKLVVDSCVVIKWLVDEPDSLAARQLFTACVSGGTRLLAPDLVYPEIGSILWKKARRQLITVDEAHRAFSACRRLPVLIEPAMGLLDEALQIAHDCGQSPYDCLYVALSNRAGCPLVTSDEKLFRKVSGAFSQIVLLPTHS